MKKILNITIYSFFFIYGFFFIFLPQSWTLMDDYGYALRFKLDNPNPFQLFYENHSAIMSVGRFRPVDFLFRALRYSLYISPAFFHLFQLALTAVIFIFFSKILKYFKLTFQTRLFILIIVASAFSIKDMIVYSTAAETLALLFFLISFYYFLLNRKVISFLCFTMCLLSKETSFVFLAPFIVLSYFEKRKNYLQLLLYLFSCIAFVLFVKSLPQVYTSSYKLANITLSSVYISFLYPLIRNFFPFLIIIPILYFKFKPSINITTLTIGVAILASYTTILLPWGHFNSWYYAHIPIPFGWALVFASFVPILDNLNGVLIKLTIGATCIFSVLVTLNGSNNYYTYFKEAKIAAQKMCEYNIKFPNNPIFTNCFEASGQLVNYLNLEDKCSVLPKPILKTISSFKNEIKNLNNAFGFLYSSKCEYPIVEWNLRNELNLKYWKFFVHD